MANLVSAKNAQMYEEVDKPIAMQKLQEYNKAFYAEERKVKEPKAGSRAFYAVLNQADTPQRQLLGKQTLCVLQERYRVNGVLTQFEERERA